MNARILPFLCVIVGWAAVAAAQSPLNLDFEAQRRPGVPERVVRHRARLRGAA